MPFTLALAATLASLAASGIGIGETLANRPGGGTPKPPAAAAGVTTLQNAATQNAEKAAIGQQVPNILASTSGLANPEYVAQISQLLAGTAGASGSSGAAHEAVKKAFGITASEPGGGATPGVQGTSTPNFKAAGVETNPNPAGQPTNLSDFVTSFLYR